MDLVTIWKFFSWIDTMDEFTALLKPIWGAEKWISEGWDTLTSDEKKIVKGRMDDLFKDGLPFELEKPKLFYIYTFSLLAQLEVLAIQVPLKFESKMSKLAHRKRMRLQLLDEIFHGLVFTKIVFMLCSPYAMPPEYNPNIEVLCNFIRAETCPKVAMMLLNLIGEGWIEEIFYSLKRCNIAPKVFTTIIDDEHRHVSEADLYRDIGMPDQEIIQPKIAYLEDQLLTNIFMQYKCMFSVCALLGVEGVNDFKQALHKKHVQQLKKINLEPTDNWKFFMRCGDELLPKIQYYSTRLSQIEMTSLRKFFMTQWDDPSDPTMTAFFDLDINCLDFFNKKFPSETVTLLMTQAISLLFSMDDSLRNFLSFKTMFRNKHAYVGLVVKLPDCGDHLGTIVLENCHEISFTELSKKIQSIIKKMVYCYKKREFLEKTNPRVQQIMNDMIKDISYSTYDTPMPGSAFVSVSNVGFCGYKQCKSPLRRNETIKYTLMEVERKLVWNQPTQSFEPQDSLPISISADHRIFDGNTPIPKLTTQCFNTMFSKMLNEQPTLAAQTSEEDNLEMLVETLLSRNVDMGYKSLLGMQTLWLEFLSLETLLSEDLVDEMLYGDNILLGVEDMTF